MTKLEDIQIINIEDALTKLHAEAAHEQTHASLFNMILYSKDSGRMGYLRTLLREIITQFPSRILVIKEDENSSGDYLRVNVSSEVRGKIACDHISIEATSDNLKRVPFIILPHLIPDLPVYLVWGQDPTSDEMIMPHLKPFVSRLVYDADAFGDLHDFSRKILEMMQTLPYVDFVDINWILMGGWRRVCRQVFASAALRKYLQNPTDIQIGYNNISTSCPMHLELQGKYLLHWLASCMRWKIISKTVENGSITYACKSNSNKFNVTLFQQYYEDIACGAVTNLEIVSGDQSFVIAPFPAQAKVVIHISSLETCELPYTIPLSSLKPGFPYVKELLFSPISDHYPHMLESLRDSP